jgi:hypothetical protein
LVGGELRGNTAEARPRRPSGGSKIDEEASGLVQRLAVPLHAHLRRAGGLLGVGEVTGELGIGAGLHGPPRRLRPPGEFLSKEKNGGNLVRERRGERDRDG